MFAKARRMDPDKLRQAKAEFRELEAAGIIRRPDSPWSSPLHMVRKKDGSWRPCGDNRRLNLATTHDCYPLPSILDLSNKLHSCKFFSCIGLVKGYHQIPMAAKDVTKTAIITPFDLFENLFMPFVLRNAAQTFQRFKDSLLAPPLRVLLLGRHHRRQPHPGEAPRASPADLHHPSGEWRADQPSKVRVRRCRHGVLGTPGGPAWRPAAPAARTGH